MGCISTLCRIFIIFVNIIFLIIGLALFAGGLFLRFGDKFINALVTAVETEIEAAINDVFSTTTNVDLDVGKLLLGIALACIFTGLGFIIISLSGCCGSCYKIKCFLIFYVVVCAILLIGQVIVVGIVFGKPDAIKKPIKTTLKKTIKSDFAGLKGTDIVSIAWNIIMQWLQCCGAGGESDFTEASKWNKTAVSGSTLVRPLACCVNLPTSTTVTCATSSAVAGTYFTSGCVDTIWSLIFTKKFKLYVYGVLSGIGGFQLLLIAAAIVLLCSEMNSKKNKTYPEAPQAYAGKKPSKRSVNPDPRGRRY